MIFGALGLNLRPRVKIRAHNGTTPPEYEDLLIEMPSAPKLTTTDNDLKLAYI